MKRQKSTTELFLRRMKSERRRFINICKSHGIKPLSYDEATNTHMCLWSRDECQIGEYKPMTTSTSDNIYVTEEEYDRLIYNENEILN